MFKKLKKVFKEFGEYIVYVFKKIFVTEDNSPSISFNYGCTEEYRRWFEDYIERLEQLSNRKEEPMFKVGDKIKIKDDICKNGALEWLGECFVIEKIETAFDYLSNKYWLECYSDKHGYVKGRIDCFELYFEYDKLIDFMHTLK